MVGMDNYKMLFIQYGEFVAKTMLDGIIHPDIQRTNIGVDNRGPRLLDLKLAKRILIPDELDSNRVRQMTEALFPLIDGTEDSFLNCSYLRIGFLTRGGILAKELFANAINNGFSSSSYIKHPKAISKYDASKLYGGLRNQIREWKELDLDSINLGRYPTLNMYEKSDIRASISEENKFYLDMLYLMKACLLFKDKEELKIPYAITLLNMAGISLKNCKPYTEYGLLKKCLKTYSGVQQIEKMCKSRLFSILPTWDLNPDYIDFIDDVIDKYDLFEFLWILDDVDLFNKYFYKD